ncbi:tRNA threonylcarbamoyladenosine dehydratase [Hutsoniella sourekii]
MNEIIKHEKEPHRFSRLELLLGEDRLKALKESTVMVLGLGGVGSSCAEALARGGIGHLILIDKDTVDITNINRQALAFTSTIGRVKAEVMAEMVGEINPDCRVTADQVELDRDRTPDQLAGYPRPDYVIDCIDLVLTKAQVAYWCQGEGIPLLASMGAGNKLDPEYLRFDDIMNTRNCPLSKVMRREYRKLGIDHQEVLYSNQAPVNIKDPLSPDRSHTLGTMSYMPPIVGQMLAGKVLRRLAGLESSFDNLSKRR